MNQMKLGFEMRRIRLPLTAILPIRQVKEAHKKITRYKTILAALKEVGLIEPLVVYPQKDGQGTYLLVEGNLRYAALKDLGQTEADCIVSTDDESFTYNSRVNRLNPIQENKMIIRAVKNGVPPERIAAALNLALRDVKASMSLLDGIHGEAADVLKDKNISPKAIRLLKKVTGVRQIEIAELMVSANNFTTGYAEALVLGTPKDQLANPAEPKAKEGLSREDIARLEQEMESLEHDLKAVEESYGDNVLNLTCARGYIKKLLENAKVVRFLNGNYRDIFIEFEAISTTETL
jgi:ParB-like chromosome segregation protein Spo0J